MKCHFCEANAAIVLYVVHTLYSVEQTQTWWPDSGGGGGAVDLEAR